MIVKRIEEKMFKDLVIFEAEEFEECYIGSLLGERNYWVNEGERVRMKVPKSWCLEAGDEVDLDDIVIYLGGLSDKISWE